MYTAFLIIKIFIKFKYQYFRAVTTSCTLAQPHECWTSHGRGGAPPTLLFQVFTFYSFLCIPSVRHLLCRFRYLVFRLRHMCIPSTPSTKYKVPSTPSTKYSKYTCMCTKYKSPTPPFQATRIRMTLPTKK